LINAHIFIKFNTSVKSIDDGVKHLQTVLSTGSSREICIQPKLKSGLCPLHSELDIEIMERNDEQLCAKMIIKYPICMCGRDSGISTFLGSLLYYTVFSFVVEYHILDFDITDEEEVFGLFSGPKHGVKGIRDLLDEQNEPLIGLILKPRTKIDLIAQKKVVEELACSGKINYIIDDELVISPRCCYYGDKIDCYSDLIHQIATKYHHKMLYWVNVSCDISISQKIIEYSISKGVNTFSLNAVTMGFTSVKYIIEKYSQDALFLVNNVGRGILTRPLGFFMSECVLSKISRLIGADAVYTGPLTKEFPYDATILEIERKSLQDVWWTYKKSFSVTSGDIDTTKNARENIQALGKDTMIQMGAGLLGTGDVLSKLTAFKFLVSNTLNPEVMKHVQEALQSEEITKISKEETTMTTSEAKRVDLLKTKLSGQITNRIRLVDALSKTRDPLTEGRYEEDLEKCEKAILDFALQLAELSTQYQQIEMDTYLTSDLLEICKRNANKVSETDFDEVKAGLIDVSKEISREILSSEASHQDIERLKSELSAKGTLELTIPIIPLLLNYKTELSIETKLNLKKMIVSLFRKIKSVLI